MMNCLAWGGNHFSNRNPGLWENVEQYDIRLYGKHCIQYSVVAHPGDWKETNSYSWVEKLTHSVQSMVTGIHSGKLPDQLSVFENKEPEIVFTSIRRGEKPQELVGRGYETQGKTIPAQSGFIVESGESIQYHSLDGKGIQNIFPYQIFEFTLKKGTESGEAKHAEDYS